MIRNLLSAALLLSLASGCATHAAPAETAKAEAPPVAAPAQQVAAPASTPATVQVATATPAKKEFHPDDMVCRTFDVTGSRVQRQRVCKTRQQWIEEARAAREAMRDMQNRDAGQPGGEQLAPAPR